MKKIFLMMTAISILALTACIKEEEDTSVDMSQLVGKWVAVNDVTDSYLGPKLTYIFYRNGKYNRVVYDVMSSSTTTYTGTYEIFGDGPLIRLSDEGKTGFYGIRKLNHREMVLTDIVSSYFSADRIFVRVTD